MKRAIMILLSAAFIPIMRDEHRQTDRQAYIYFLLSHTRDGASPQLFYNNYSIFYLLLLILQKLIE